MNYIVNKCEILLSILFILYLVLYEDNLKMAEIVDIPQIKITIIIVSLLLFIFCNKILGILGIFVAYEMLNFSHNALNNDIIGNLFEDEIKLFNFPAGMESIEEEMVYKMMPIAGISSYLDKCSYKPMSSTNNIFSF